MASGHVNRANRPNTWPHPTPCIVTKTLANTEPSTHGTFPKCRLAGECLPIEGIRTRA